MHDTCCCFLYCRWSATGALYLSNIRLVFVADKADPSGLAGFDMPLVYICKEKLNQPIFGCNNLAGAHSVFLAGTSQLFTRELGQLRSNNAHSI